MRTATRRTDDGSAHQPRAKLPYAQLDISALQNAIFNSATFSSIATDAKGVIQIFNVGAERMLGYAADEVLDRITPADISDPDEVIARAAALSLELGTPIAPGFEALVFKASRGIEDVYELTYVRKDGSRFPAIVSVTALRDSADVIIGYLLIGTDNTARKAIEDERKTLELALRQKNAELETASRMKSEFLANMSHELRTPLNAIIGFSEVLADGLIGELTEKQRGFISDIFSSGKHLLSLINDILDLSKVEAGKMLLDLESVQIAPLVTNSLSIVREKASSRRINLTMDATGVGSVQADGRKVKQIVYNLLSNAVKFTAERGDVTLRAARVPRSAVGHISSGTPGRTFPLADSAFEEFLEISVTDTGMGIPPESIDSLFKPFSQIDSGLSRKFEGTGLGLAMVKLLADLHGGAVAVESTLGKGSRFTVWLPVRAPHEVATPLPPPRVFSSSEWGPEAHVALVVEDDQKSADLVRVQLEAEGFRVVHAPTAEQGLILAQQHPPALITLDIMLPNMDGWEFLSRLKQMPDLKSVPVVIISIVADADKGFALGASRVMQKPISRQDLYESLLALNLLPKAESGALTVLVVDDDPAAVEMVALHIKDLATTVLRAHGGREAIELARRDKPDLIVLDLMMPEVTGFDVVAALNEEPGTARIPVLVVTSMDVSDADRARLNAVTIIHKDAFDLDRFTMEVRRAMAGRHAAI